MADIAHSTVPAGSTDGWKDKKRYLWLIGLVVPSLAFIGYGMWALTGWGVWFWIGPIVILVVVPAIDLVAGLDRSNPPDDVIEGLEQDRYYRWITYLFLPIQYVGFVGAMYLIAEAAPDLTTFDKVGLAVSIGCIGGIGINTAHELGHKREANERWLSKIALAPELLRPLLHRAQPRPPRPRRDPRGPGVARGWARTSTSSGRARSSGSVKSAWRLEKRRYARKQPAPVPDRQRRAQRLADVARAVGRAGRVARRRRSCRTC